MSLPSNSGHKFKRRLETHKADHTVQALPVVVQLNLLKHPVTHAFAHRKMLADDGFNFQAMEDRLGAGVVVQGAFALMLHVRSCSANKR